MKIEDKRNNKITGDIDDFDIGDILESSGHIYLKIHNKDYEYPLVDLYSNLQCRPARTSKFVKLNARLVIED